MDALHPSQTPAGCQAPPDARRSPLGRGARARLHLVTRPGCCASSWSMSHEMFSEAPALLFGRGAGTSSPATPLTASEPWTKRVRHAARERSPAAAGLNCARITHSNV